MISYVLSKLITMCLGQLYPAYCSYKAVKTKNVKEYVHWMMYWIVFAIYSSFEVFVDTFIGCWFPFYYELKIVFIIWMLSPQTRGGSVLYRRIIHPMFTRHEPEIDAYLADFQHHASHMLVKWGTNVFHYVTEMVMNTVLKASSGDMTFFKHKQRSYPGIEGFDQQDLNRNNQRSRDENDGMFSDNETSADARDNRSRPWMEWYGSPEQDMNRQNGLPKPNSMMNLGTVEAEGQPPKSRSSTRKKKEVNAYGTIPRSTTKTTRRAKVNPPPQQ